MNNRSGGSFFGSLIGILFGIGLFFGSFVLIWFNEGRVDLSKVAGRATVITSDQVEAANEGELVAVTGIIESSEPLGDGLYLEAGPYISLQRTVEMYAWEETSSSDDDGNTEYSYDQTWTETPQDSSNFVRPEGHQNPILEIQSRDYLVTDARIGQFPLDPNQIFFMFPQSIELNDGILTRPEYQIRENYLFFGEGTLENPQIGDRRVAYTAFPSGESGTTFGRQQNGRVEPYYDEEGTILYRAYSMGLERSIEALRTEYLQALWGFRFGGFGMMWVGLLMMFGPIRFILGYIPLIGRVGNFVIGVVTFIVAAILSVVTITIAVIFHNLILLTITLLILIGVGYFFISRRRDKAAE